MKKLLIALIAALFFSGAVAQSFPDIPEGHWAGDAVEEIAELGIVIGFPDGTFRGNEAFTRYQTALVVSRLLAVIEDNMDAAMAMTNGDIASLRNAVQELAADVAAQGVRISAAEGAVAGLSDDTMANAARLDELEAMIAGMDMEIDPAVLRDLQNQIASQRVAIDTAQATADAAASDAAQAQARANAAATSAGQNASEIAALNELIQILSGQIDALEAEMGSGVEAASADRVAALEGDIANIREFVILLRRDQVALRDSVSALEASDSQQAADIADLQARVTELESNPLGLSGSIDLTYYVGRGDGALAEFDIDRAYGLNAMRDIGASTFSSGVDEELAGDDDEVDEPGEYAQDRADISYESDFSADLSLSLGSERNFDGEGAPRGLNSFSAVVNFTIESVEDATDANVDADFADAFVFAVEEFTTTFDPIGAAPLTFAFGEEVTGSFTPYTLNLETIGFVATVGAPDFLAFLDPGLWVAYLTDAVTDSYVTTGIRGTLSPLDGITGGFSLVRNADNTGDKGDADADNVNDLVWGLDAQASLELGVLGVDLAAEYANASIDDGAYADSVLFVTADTMLDFLGGIDLGANYRDIALDWENQLGSGVALTDEDDYPFESDQTGFGVNAGLGLWIFDISAYFDSYSIDAGTDVMAYGVDVSADLFRAFSVSGFFDQVSLDGTLADTNDGAPERDNQYDTGFGVTVAHDGSADNALIPMLNIEAGYAMMEEDYSVTEIYADADYTLSISIVTVTPYVGFESNSDTDTDDSDTTIKAGTGLTTAPLDVIFQPSLEASVNYRTTSYVTGGVDDFTSTELQWAVGLNLGEFLLPYSSLSARYGYWTGTNITGDIAGDAGTDISDGDLDNGDNAETVSGFEVEWNYYDLVFSYGIYNYEDIAGATTGAQAFEVAYSVDF